MSATPAWVKRNKVVFALIAAIFNEFWFDMCAYTANHQNLWVAATVNFTFPFITLFSMALFVEEETVWGRVKIATATGIGYTLGTMVFLFGVRPHL